MTDAVNSWNILAFDAANSATNLAVILYTIAKTEKAAAKVKGPFHRGTVMLHIIMLLSLVLKMYDPETRLKDAITKWEEGLNTTTSPNPHKYGVFDYNNVSNEVFDAFKRNFIQADNQRIRDVA